MRQIEESGPNLKKTQLPSGHPGRRGFTLTLVFCGRAAKKPRVLSAHTPLTGSLVFEGSRGSFVALPRWPHQRVPAALARQRGTERDDDDNVRERACFALGAL